MKLFENGVGRPTNEVKKKRRYFVAGISLAVIGLVGVSLGFMLTKPNNINVSRLRGDGPGATYSKGSVGDIDGDGFITMKDVDSIFLAIVNRSTRKLNSYTSVKKGSQYYIEKEDINSDGKVDYKDLKLIYRMMYKGYQLGDYNMDGIVSYADYEEMLDDVKHSSYGQIPTTTLKTLLGDINCDTYVDIKDEELILPIIIKSNAEKEVLVGDINGDGIINIADYNIALKVSKKQKVLTISQRNRADINKDGKVNSKDAEIIKRIYNTVVN